MTIVPSREDYETLLKILTDKGGTTELSDRRHLAGRAFAVSSHYDTAIFNYFNEDNSHQALKISELNANPLRYGENPHQAAIFYGRFEQMFTKLNGKEISYNNLVDIDAAVGIMAEFAEGDPTFAILKHTNACGVAVRDSQLAAWKAALAADDVSAFGGILITNRPVELTTAQEIDKLFYEVLIAPDFTDAARELLSKKKKRILLQYHHLQQQPMTFKSLLNGVVAQQADLHTETEADFTTVTEREPTPGEVADLVFAGKCAKHLKSNTIALVKDRQMIAMGNGQNEPGGRPETGNRQSRQVWVYAKRGRNGLRRFLPLQRLRRDRPRRRYHRRRTTGWVDPGQRIHRGGGRPWDGHGYYRYSAL